MIPSPFYGNTLACSSGQRLHATLCGRWWSALPAYTYVVDDFGNLAPQTPEQNAQGVHFVHGCPSIDEAGDEYMLAAARVRDLEIELHQARRAMLKTLVTRGAQ